MSDTTKLLTPRVTYHRDTDTLSVSLRHREAEGVSSVTSSYMTQLEMTPHQWKQYLDAVGLELDQLAGVCGVGYDERLPPCGKCERCLNGLELADRIAEHAHAT